MSYVEPERWVVKTTKWFDGSEGTL